MTELALFASTFLVVFALGLQSLNVNGGHYWWAFFTSFVIGAANLVLFKLAPNATTSEAFAYLTGGPFGIVLSMWVHRRWIRRAPREAAVPNKEDIEARVVRYIAHLDVVTIHQILRSALEVPPPSRTIELARAISVILTRQGWTHTRLPNTHTWAWRKPEPVRPAR